ncbi:MAG: DUF3667 domain-containing protein [Cyclobacteriaceae bacterium]|nr:DUF3667 domain-containing protein [Cyclobacteriaceae bacterium]
MDTPESTHHICKSCSNSFVGLYCNQCGEKVIVARDRTFRSFLSDIIKALTFADNQFIRTLWLVFRKPGFISAEMSEGRTVRYLKPLNLFFLLNLVYFLFPVIQIFSATLRTQLNSFHGRWVQQLVARKMISEHIGLDSFTILYNDKTVGFAKMLVIVFAVLASLPLTVLYSKKNRLFTDHVGLSVELVCFNLTNALLLTLLAKILPLGAYLTENTLTGFFVATNLYFLLRSGHFFYQEKAGWIVMKAMLMLGFLKIALELFRLILFFVTLASL